MQGLAAVREGGNKGVTESEGKSKQLQELHGALQHWWRGEQASDGLVAGSSLLPWQWRGSAGLEVEAENHAWPGCSDGRKERKGREGRDPCTSIMGSHLQVTGLWCLKNPDNSTQKHTFWNIRGWSEYLFQRPRISRMNHIWNFWWYKF